MHLNPSLRQTFETIENHRKTVLKKLDDKKFISSRRLKLIARMAEFRDSVKYQKPYHALDVDEQTIMTNDIEKIFKKIH